MSVFHRENRCFGVKSRSAEQPLVHPHPDIVGLVGLVSEIDSRRENDAHSVDDPLGNLPSVIRLLVEVANQASSLLDVRALRLLVLLQCHMVRPTCLAYMNATN